ncbi:site-specific tyrosine recombinase XerC [Pseudomarimonas arenosa]|uniref:Site-specific tyrosine recombinase XerC n=1 Tax=Pseudomarimonas arenosa TaxID=2774145 RepID=A0AAW3ZR66_9GAMM|nr:site-specific tyrosine recombinase XerC [Pseudomarimonas arenosa]MBD8528203.1 site-specific tyrosine recombinase XerC [Pseudomarimonas arenosa]
MSAWPTLLRQFLDASAAKGMSPLTITTRERGLRRFIAWCEERELAPEQITLPLLERYQRHLHHARKRDGSPLSLAFQQQLLLPLNALFRWLVRSGQLAANPAADLELPRLPKRLPRHWLSVEEIEQLLRHVAIYGEVGIRDRAIIETLYSTGLRRGELLAMKLDAVNHAAGIVRVIEGKGRKDRVVPIGERALAWLLKYRDEVRPLWVIPPDDRRLWLRPDGKPLRPSQLTERMKTLLAEAGIDTPGACHILRHSMATHMLDRGADVRYLQAMLGHAQLSTTAIYTHVAIGQLKAVHAATHPAASLTRKPKAKDSEDTDDGAA